MALQKPSLISPLNFCNSPAPCRVADYSDPTYIDTLNTTTATNKQIIKESDIVRRRKDVADSNGRLDQARAPTRRQLIKRLIKWSPAPSMPNCVGAQLQRFVQLGLHSNCTTALQALLTTKMPDDMINIEEEKLAWLRSQLIGENGVSIETPFGKLPLLYVDHTASGKPIKFVEDFIMQHVLPSYGNTHTEDSYVGQTTTRMMHEAEAYVKKQLLGFGNEEDHAVMFCGNGCTAALKRLQEVIGVAVPPTLRTRILESGIMSAEERWLVFVGPYEHHSNLLSWRQSLAEVVEIPADPITGGIDMKFLEDALEASRRRRLKLGAFSACSNVTGLLTDTRAIGRLFHKYGGYVCFDFAAGAPHQKIQMVNNSGEMSDKYSYYDAVVLSPHKFPGGPGSPGILLMRKQLYLLQGLPPSTCGGGTVAYVNGFNDQDTIYYKNIEEREDAGTPAIIGKIRCALTFWVKDFMGETMIRQRETKFLEKAIKRLSKNPNIRILGNISPSTSLHKHMPILSFIIYSNMMRGNQMLKEEEDKIHYENEMKNYGMEETYYDKAMKPLHGRFVVRLLNDLFGVQARGGCACAGPYGHTLLNVNKEQSLAIRQSIMEGYEGLKPGWTRVSFGYNMLDSEVDYVLSAIEFIAHYGHYFLQLYNFNWHTGNWTILRDKSCNKYNTSTTGFYTYMKSLLEKSNKDMANYHQKHLRKVKQMVDALIAHYPCIPQSINNIPNDINDMLILFHV